MKTHRFIAVKPGVADGEGLAHVGGKASTESSLHAGQSATSNH